MQTQPAETEVNRQSAEQDLAALGKRVAYLLYMAPLTEEAKTHIVNVLPFLSFAQIDDLCKLLENSIQQSSGDPNKDALVRDIEQMVKTYGEKYEALQADSLGKLRQLEEEIAAAEKTAKP